MLHGSEWVQMWDTYHTRQRSTVMVQYSRMGNSCRGIMSASSHAPFCFRPHFASIFALMLATKARQSHPPPPPPPPPSRTDRDLWRKINNNSNNRANGPVSATHVCLPLRRSSPASHVHHLFFPSFSVFHIFTNPLTSFRPRKSSRYIICFISVAAVSFSNERTARMFSISGLTYNSTKIFVVLILRT